MEILPQAGPGRHWVEAATEHRHPLSRPLRARVPVRVISGGQTTRGGPVSLLALCAWNGSLGLLHLVQ